MITNRDDHEFNSWSEISFYFKPFKNHLKKKENNFFIKSEESKLKKVKKLKENFKSMF